jgi:hypothetical protein
VEGKEGMMPSERVDATIAIVLFLLVLAAAVWFPKLEAVVDPPKSAYAP